jgi:hypothetical protein
VPSVFSIHLHKAAHDNAAQVNSSNGMFEVDCPGQWWVVLKLYSLVFMEGTINSKADELWISKE